eukprot:SM000003S11143  [mRNA]  locus=s3:1187229:1191231:+ [translate_table: standard]
MAPGAAMDGGAYAGNGGAAEAGHHTTIKDKVKHALHLDSGEARLKELGYKQELTRSLSAFTNYGFGYSEIGVMMGVTGLYSIGYAYGGPVSLVWGWVIVAFGSNLISLSLGEICSAFPTVGGVYFWSHHLGGKYGNIFSWIAGWFNLLAGFANVASVDMICANLIGQMILLSTGTATGGGYYPSKGAMLGIFSGILLIHVCINIAGIWLVGPLENISVFWDFIGTIIVMIVIPTVAVKHQSAKFVFTEFITDTAPGIHSEPYIFVVGLLTAAFTIVGYDAAAHMTEETKGADKTVGIAMWLAVVVSSITGFGYILALTFSIQDPVYVGSLDNETAGYTGAQIYYDAFYSRYQSGTGAIILLGIPLGAAWFSGMSCLTAASRICWSFNRDKAFPGWQMWRRVGPFTQTPVMAILLVAVCAFGFACLWLVSLAAFNGVTSVVVIGFYLSYLVPLVLRMTLGRNMEPGPFSLGKFGPVVAFFASCYVIAIVVVLSLPTIYPITIDTLNYAPVAVGCTVVLATTFWFGCYLWKGGPFEGPIPTVEDDYDKPIGQAFGAV